MEGFLMLNHEDLNMQCEQPQMLSRFSRQSGFSILEALIAAVIVSSGLLASAKFQAKMFQQGTLVKDRSLALQAANDKIEKVRLFPNNVSLSPSGSEIINTSQTPLNRTWIAYAGPVAGYNEMKVNVQWNDTHGATALDLISYIRNTDPRVAGQNLYVQRTLPNRTVPTRYTATISGTISGDGNSGWQVSVNLGTCTVSGNSYTCSVDNLPDSAQQNIDVTFSADSEVACGSGGGNSLTTSVAVNDGTAVTQNFSYAPSAGLCV
jgi:hypothetical protein